MGFWTRDTIFIGFKSKDAEHTALSLLQQFIRGINGNGTNFNLDAMAPFGGNLDSIDGIVRILLACQQNDPEFKQGIRKKHFTRGIHKGFSEYSNYFHSSYSWPDVIVKCFTVILPYLSDDSYYKVFYEDWNYYDRYVVKNGWLMVEHSAGYGKRLWLNTLPDMENLK